MVYLIQGLMSLYIGAVFFFVCVCMFVCVSVTSDGVVWVGAWVGGSRGAEMPD